MVAVTDRTSSTWVSPAASSCRRHRVVAVAVAVLTSFVVAAAPAFGAGRTAAGALRTATAQMQQSPGYKFTAKITTAGSSVKIAGEFQAPDRVHEVVQIGTAPPSELVMIGTQVYAKDASGTWRSTKAVASGQPDLRSTFSALRSADRVTHRGRTFTFHLRPAAAKHLVGASTTGGLTGSASLAKKGINRLRYRARTGTHEVTVTIAYTLTNPPPTVSAPA